MRNKTRVVIRVDDTSGAQLVDGNTGVEFKILPNLSSQIEAGKKYLIYLTKAIRTNIGPGGALNNIYAVLIEGLSTETNNLNLNTTVQKLPVVGIFNITKPAIVDGITQWSWENPHPKDDGIICSNPFNTRLVLKTYNIPAEAFNSFTGEDFVFELMIEEIDC